MTLFYTELPATTSLCESKEKPPETSVEPEISEKDGHFVARPEMSINNTTTTMEIESVPKDEAGMTNVKIQLEILEKQNLELINEKANLKREIENLNLFKVINNKPPKIFPKTHINTSFLSLSRIIMRKRFLNQKPSSIWCSKAKSC